jgi:hypothetical protein
MAPCHEICSGWAWMDTVALQNDGLYHRKNTELMTSPQMTYAPSENHLDDVGPQAVRFMVVIHFCESLLHVKRESYWCVCVCVCVTRRSVLANYFSNCVWTCVTVSEARKFSSAQCLSLALRGSKKWMLDLYWEMVQDAAQPRCRLQNNINFILKL